MKAFAVLGLLGLIMTFLVTLMSGFPLNAAPDNVSASSNDENTNDFNVNTVQEAGNQFCSLYCSVVEDITSFQHDPSIERAVARRDAFFEYGQNAAQDYQDFTSELIERFSQLSESTDEASSN